MNKNLSFSIRGPDRMSEELATVLSAKGSWEFKSLFELVHASLRSKGFTGGGEEMLRLRAHEKLQKFLHSGVVTKTGKEYSGVPKALVNFFKLTAELNAKVAEAIQNRAALQITLSEAPQTKGPETPKRRPPIRKTKTGRNRVDVLL